jgi:excinuclease ABC subunit A
MTINKEFHNSDAIIVKGARTHNLKNVNVTLPRGKLIAITGLSGSGKSSLAFDTIFAEGQRRYVESLSSYARQFLSQMPKPDVDEITGLSPAISIDQKSGSRNPRSTVATMTEIYDYLRVLFARIGKAYSPISGDKIQKLSHDEIVRVIKDKIELLREKAQNDGSEKQKTLKGVSWNETMFSICAPVVRGRKGEYYHILFDAIGKGFRKVRVDGTIYNVRDKVTLSKTKPHTIDLIIEEFAFFEAVNDPTDFTSRLAESIERAILEADGLVRVIIHDETLEESEREFLLSGKFVCPSDGFLFPEIEPRMFSFNSPYGACSNCKGLGMKNPFSESDDTPCDSCAGARLRFEAGFVFIGNHEHGEKAAQLGINMQTSMCESEKEILSKKSNTKRIYKGINLFEFSQLSIFDAHEVLFSLDLSKKDMEIAHILLNEIESRLKFLLDVGLDYLSLNRRANTISGGEAQRIRLASQLGSKLVGALYVLDEPTIGLHQRDNQRLIKTLLDLRDLGNTIIVVEHDEDTIRASDYLVEIGPKAGRFGGEVILSDFVAEVLSKQYDNVDSLTRDYLLGNKAIPMPAARSQKEKGKLIIIGATFHNLNNVNAEVPLGKMVGITGVSGSGKSTFMYDIVYNNLRAKLEREHRQAKPHHCSDFVIDGSVTRTVMIDQSPVGRTPRSNPATYTGMWTFIRDLFAETIDARARGYTASRFSFNVKGGRCEACEGRGEIAVEMHFLPTVYVVCDVCNGKRFDKETLSVLYKGKNVSQILEMTVEEAHQNFSQIPAICDRLKAMIDVGLSYIKLGQSATTLSGGESQRVKIASELYRPNLEKTIYLLDEPTVGLHFDDVAKLVIILQELVARGNSVLLIEHSMDIIKCCDYLIDFGPNGGKGGGKIVAKGTPESVANNKHSITGEYLKHYLK